MYINKPLIHSTPKLHCLAQLSSLKFEESTSTQNSNLKTEKTKPEGIFKRLINKIKELIKRFFQKLGFFKAQKVSTESTKQPSAVNVEQINEPVPLDTIVLNKKLPKNIEPSAFLLSPEFQRIWKRNASSHQRLEVLTGTALFLRELAATEDQVKLIPQIIDKLDREEKYDKQCMYDTGMQSDFRIDASVLLEEKIWNKDFNKPDDAIFIARQLMSKPRPFWHGTNSKCLESINKLGLTRERPPITGYQEVVDIFQKHNLRKYWHLSNTEQTIHLARQPQAAISYSLESPEWFYLFCNFSCRTGSHQESKRRIESIFSKESYPTLSDEERKKCMGFFEQAWKVYGGGKPMVISAKNLPREHWTIRSLARYTSLPAQDWRGNYGFNKGTEREAENYLRRCTPEAIKSALYHPFRHQAVIKVTEHDIAPENLEVFALPNELLQPEGKVV